MTAPLPAAEAAPLDFITGLKSAGPKLTKTFDGETVLPYDEAKHFSVFERKVGNIQDLSAYLVDIEKRITRCVIRGRFIGDAEAQRIAPPKKPGHYPRTNELFRDVPHHWVMFDIDAYRPMLYDPVLEPEKAIDEFIRDKLPAEFHGVTFHWQLSSSAGRKPGELKCHIWYWLTKPYPGAALTAWVRRNQLPIDVSPFRQVQVHYTANPVFLNGAVDPVPGRRSGLCSGLVGEVPLEIPDDLLELAAARQREGGRVELTDPTLKEGTIGAFCRAYPIDRLINEELTEHFVFAEGSDHRVTWLGGGGSPEGAFVTDDGLHLGSTHDSDEFEGVPVNAFDLARWYKFGHLDHDLDKVTAVYTRPSYFAMLAWAESLPDVRAALGAATVATRTEFSDAILNAPDELALRETVLPSIRACASLDKADREHLAGLLQNKWRALLGTKMRIADARGMVARERVERDAGGLPGWLSPWVYVTDSDKFFDLDSKQRVTRQGFDMLFNSRLMAFADADGNVPSASRMCADVWGLETVSHVAYLPGFASTFEMLGASWANLYREGSVPPAVPVLTDAEKKLVQLMHDHAARQFPCERERNLLLDYLAFNIQNTGQKIRWAPFIHGTPGDGKTFWFELLSQCIGAENTKILNASTLGSDFTSWGMGAAFVCIEEAKLHGHNNWDIANKLKPFITNSSIEIHPKGKDPFNVPNCTNYLVLSNFPDGIPLEKGDRRWMVLASAISEHEAIRLTEDGTFQRLFDAVRDNVGAFRRVFLDRQLSAEFNPDGRAPATQAKDQTIELSKSDLLLAAEKVLEKGGEGITKEVVSSDHFTAALRAGSDFMPRGPSVKHLFTQMGLKSLVKKIFWRGEARRVYATPAFLEKMATAMDSSKFIRDALDAAGFEDADF